MAARVSQVAVEVLRGNIDGKARVSQVAVEVLTPYVAGGLPPDSTAGALVAPAAVANGSPFGPQVTG